MLFTKSYVTNSRLAKDQLNQRDIMRTAANLQEANHKQMLKGLGLEVNAGLIPQEVYQEFDSSTIELMRSDDGDTFLNDLLPLARSVNIGKLTYVTRRSSDAGTTQTSMSGQIGVKMDQVEYSYDGTVVPIHDTGFFRNWRELEAQKSEGFDSLIDDQRESVRALRRHLRDSFMNGCLDVNGNAIVVDGRQWLGMKTDTRVVQVANSLFDFTGGTAANNKINLITLLDNLWITNNCTKDVVIYVSREIARNWETDFNTNYNQGKISEELAGLQGVSSIKTTNALSGNQIMMFPLDGSVRPVSGMGISTMALPRPLYNSNHEFITAGAIGWMVDNDYAGNSCALNYD
jgi:hypothetical protein